MGYTTRFDGSFKLDNPLTVDHIALLRRLADDTDSEVAPSGRWPGKYLQWVPTESGDGLEWDGNEKFYQYAEWLEYIIKHYLIPWGHTLNGEVRFQGEDPDDRGAIFVTNNVVYKVKDTVIPASVVKAVHP